MTRMKGVSSPNVLHFSASPKLHRKPWSRGEERALVQFVCLHEDRKSPTSTAVWPSMNPSDSYWKEAALYIQTTTGKSHLRTGNGFCTLLCVVDSRHTHINKYATVSHFGHVFTCISLLLITTVSLG